MDRVRVRVRVLSVRVRVRVLTKGLESESDSLKIWTRVRLEYTVGLEYYITAILTLNRVHRPARSLGTYADSTTVQPLP